MSLVKIGESISITASDIQSPESVLSDPEIQNQFEKIAKELKIIAPKGDDFLYFSAIMMHAAEHAAINDDGSFKVAASGEPIKVWWDKKGESVFWKSNDASIKPFKNNNGDIFPESELISAHKKWVGKPLCLDHKSSSVDMIRGLIVDTYYDRKLKRVVALCALDKKNYPDLARKVSTGYAASVSMGTGVGKAICYDCGNVARTEHDFCSHMKNKSCYGEVNLDLNPIELSIVVNGADPKAKIKTIIAAANSIAKYVEMKEDELSKVEPKFKQDRVKDMVKSLDDIMAQLKSLQEEVVQLSEEMEETTGSKEDEEIEKSASDQSSEFALKNISDKLDTIFERINKLYSFNKDEKMTTKKQAYFQGGGGANEPQTYPKEEADKIRDTMDKQMTGQMDTGPVTGMHPGYDSFGESEEARKRRLQRLAEEEMRSLRRQAALEAAKANLAKKQAYFQGGGGANEPQTYPKEDADKIRDKEDRQMNGASPFPNTGAVDGLFPGDQDKKEKLSRAKLTARFLKAAAPNGNDDPGNSRWEVFADKKLVFSASVNDITGGRATALYDSVANETFGRSLIAKIRTNGLQKVATMYKAAQAQMPAAPAMPAPAGGAVPMPAMPEAAPAMPGAAPDLSLDLPEGAPDLGGKGDPAADLPRLLDEAESVLADIRKGVEALQNQAAGGKGAAPAGEFDELAGPAASGALAPTTASLVSMQRKLGKTILAAMKETAVKLASVSDELRLAKKVLVKNASREVRSTVEESKAATREVLADCYTLMSAFSKYASSTELLVKQASKEVQMVKMAQMQAPSYDSERSQETRERLKQKTKQPTPPSAPPAPKKEMYMPDSLADDGMDDDGMHDHGMHDHDHDALGDMSDEDLFAALTEEEEEGDAMMAHDMLHSDDLNLDLSLLDDENDAMVKMHPDGTVEGEASDIAKLKTANDLSTKEGRAAYRAKQAAKAMQFSKILQDAHGKGGPVLSDMKGELAKVETLEEVSSAMHDVATKEVSAKTKKAAADIQKLVVAGRIEASEVDNLVKAGLDKEAVKYWKDFYGQAKDKASKEFAAELTSEHAQAKKAENMEAFRVKIARAYDLANEMAMKGLIGRDKHAIKEQVDELMSFNDAGFDSMKKHVERTPMSRTASYAMPQVGLMSEELIATASDESNELVNEFAAAFANRKY